MSTDYPSKMLMWSKVPDSYPVPMEDCVENTRSPQEVHNRMVEEARKAGYKGPVLVAGLPLRTGWRRFQSAALPQTLDFPGDVSEARFGVTSIFGSEHPRLEPEGESFWLPRPRLEHFLRDGVTMPEVVGARERYRSRSN